VRFELPQPATRHALVETHDVAGSAPVRRGIAVVAVVGGLAAVGSAAGVPFPQPRDATDVDPATVGLAAQSKQADDDDDDDADDDSRDARSDSRNDSRDDDDTAVLDSDAVAASVRSANDEGRRLAEQERRSHDGDDRAATADASDDRSTASASTGGGTASMPGELIDTNDWYLTLPTGSKGKPDTIDGSKLASYHSKFFALNESRDGIVFNAGADGVTTKNSHYPRSELREMDGSTKAAWSNKSGTHVFDVREAFTKLPEAKPEVVGVQIHDGKDDVMQVRLEGKKLMVQYNDGKSEAILDPDYQLGTPFDTRIIAADGKVDVLYNGEKKAELPLSGSGWYWKVGAYVQSNGSKGDGASSEGEVTVYRADVKHG
jgi:alginate lyase